MPSVLVIDDDSDIRMLVGELLQREGMHVEEARDGSEGLSKARANRPDLILCDLTMPGMGGIETLSECRRDAALRSVPFLLITGMALEKEELALMRAGAAGILPKPFSSTLLLERVGAHLAKPGRDAAGAGAFQAPCA